MFACRFGRESLMHVTHSRVPVSKQCQMPPMTINAPTARLTSRLHNERFVSIASKGCGHAQWYEADTSLLGGRALAKPGRTHKASEKSILESKVQTVDRRLEFQVYK